MKTEEMLLKLMGLGVAVTRCRERNQTDLIPFLVEQQDSELSAIVKKIERLVSAAQESQELMWTVVADTSIPAKRRTEFRVACEKLEEALKCLT